jgi:outer membrane protein assembly factor BamB
VGRVTTICCSAIALLALGSASANSRTAAVLSLVPARPVWTLALNNSITAPPAYDGSRVFFSIDQNRLVAYDIASGRQLWLVDASPTFQPATGDGLIFVPEAETLTARRAADGSIAWQVPMEQPLATRLVSGSGWLIGVTASGTVLAFRAEDGHLVWQRDVGGPGHGAPALAADRVYVPAADGQILALQVTDGAVVWERRIGGVPNEVLALDQRIYAGSSDNYFYCLLARDGKIDWRWRTGADVIGMPVADARRVYFVSLDNVLRGMNLVSGSQEWMRALPVRPAGGPALAGATIVVSGQSQTIRTFDVKTGAPAQDIGAGDEVAAPPYVLTQEGTALPMLLITMRNLAKGASATLMVRTIEPPSSAVAALPNLVKPEPMPPTR